LTLATSICRTLYDAGFTAYFAGGWVRDHLLGVDCDDIDIATSAPPDTICSLFEKTISVGAQFGVIVVILEGHQFEVSTFRKDHPYHDGRHPDGVDFSTPQKDAQRRDFTINGLFFDPMTETIFDYVEGRQDLKAKIIRTIGDANLRFSEDRLRMIRAVRFSLSLNFEIEQATKEAILANSGTLLPAVSMERIWQEFNKMVVTSRFKEGLLTLHALGLLPTIFPELKNETEESLTKRVEPFAYFPLKTPTICYLLQLFPKYSLEQTISLCRYLKTSAKEIKLCTFFYEAHLLFLKKEATDYDWAHFYAHPDSALFLQIYAANQAPNERTELLDTHLNKEEKLSKHIARIQTKKPLVASSDLKKAGVQEGKRMGELLVEAEKLAINNNLHTKQQVLNLLIVV